MKKSVTINYSTLTILSFMLVLLSGCSTKEPIINTKPLVKTTTKRTIKPKKPIRRKANHKPIVKVPHDKVVNVGETIKLYANVFDKDKNDKLLYLWRISAKPKGSKLSLKNARKKAISFKVDKQGIYYLDFFATDGHVRTKAKRVTITARSILGKWKANLTKTKEENQLNEKELVEVVETLSAKYQLIFLKNGKLEGETKESWSYYKDGTYKINDSSNIKLLRSNEFYKTKKLKSGKLVKLYYKKIYKE